MADKLGALEGVGLLALVANTDTAFKAAWNLAEHIPGTTPASNPAAGGSAAHEAKPASPRQERQSNSGPAGSDAPTCDHGSRVYKSGTGAKGPWSAWMCSSRDRNSQCKPIWNN